MHVPSLKTTLGLNAAFSTLSGIAALVLAVALDEPLGLAPWLMAAIGAALVLYGVELAIGTRTSERHAVIGRFAVMADTAWVVAATLVLVFAPDALDGAGRVVLLIATLIVAELAIAQYLGLRRIATRAVA